jgi:ATP-dependent exoDNAse (exonuclease V) alpha subunit
MKNKKYLFPLLLVTVCLIAAVIVRFSYTDAGNQIYDYSYKAAGSLEDYLKANAVSSAKDLIEQADIIVKGKYNGNRKVTTDAFFSQITVSDVYKGDKSLTGKAIYVIEPVHVYPKTKFIPAKGFWIPLQTGSKYILLLKKRQFDPKRQLDEFQSSQYYPVTQGALGHYKCANERQTQLLSANQPVTLNELKNIEIFATDQQTLNTYYQYKEQILKQIKE